MRNILFLIIAILFCHISYGQILFNNSEIQLKTDSTIRGDVQFLDSNPNDIFIDNERFIPIKNIKSIINDAYKLKNFKVDGDEKILLTIVEGEALSLYREREVELFYVVKEGEIVKLEAGKKTLKKDSGGYYSKKVTKYIGILKYMSNDRPALMKDAEDLKYTEKDLKSFVIKFNNNTTSYVWKKSRKKVKYLTKEEVFFKYSYKDFYTSGLPRILPHAFEVGIRVNYKEGSRSSFSTSLQYGFVDDIKGAQLNFDYLFDFYRGERSKAYLKLRIFNVTYLWDDADLDLLKSDIVKLRLFKLNLGYRFYVKDKVNIFAELHLFPLISSKLHGDEKAGFWSLGMAYSL